MSFFQKIKQDICNEITKIRKLPRGEKAWYIWEYYKIHICVLAFVIMFAGSMLSNILNPEKIYLQNASINLYDINQQEPEPLTTAFHDTMQLGEYDTVSIHPFYLTFDDMGAENDYYTVQKLQVMVAAKELDLLFTNKNSFEQMSLMGIYGNLEEMLPEDLWDSVKDSAIYLTDPDTGVDYAAALDITNSPVIKDCEFLSDTVFVCMSPTAPNIEHCIEMLEYIYSR